MRRLDRLGRGIAAAVLAAALAAPGIPAARAAVHFFDPAECLACHPRPPGETPGAFPTLTGRIHAQCVKCHSPCDPGRRHEAGRFAPAGDAQRLPLGDEGVIDCRTCHVTHTAAPENPEGWRLLRIANAGRELCLACHRDQAPLEIHVVAPRPDVVVSGPEILLAGTAGASGAADLFVRLNGTSYSLPLREGVFSSWVSLHEGVNRIEIVAEGIVLWETEVFRAAAEALDPRAFRRLYRGHLDERRECGDCHGGAAGGFGGIASPNPSALCYRCHDRFGGKRYLHGPVAVGDCLSCHDPHGGVTEAALVEEPATLCLSCHVRGDVRHCLADTRDGSPACTACHDPHQSDARYFRRGDAPRPGPPRR